MLIKVCGMREPDNIRAIESLGIDLMGFIFYPKSPRYVSEVPSYLPTRCSRVGVFVHAPFCDIIPRVKAFGLHYIQLHGKEPPSYLMALRRALAAEGLRHVRIISMAAVGDEEQARKADLCDGPANLLLFDTPTPSYGGSGTSFSWSLLDAYQGSTPFLLSGGIGPDSLDDLRHFHHPRWAGIDLNSRFEVRPGVKDPELLQRFIETFRNNCK